MTNSNEQKGWEERFDERFVARNVSSINGWWWKVPFTGEKLEVASPVEVKHFIHDLLFGETQRAYELGRMDALRLVSEKVEKLARVRTDYLIVRDEVLSIVHSLQEEK